MVVFREKLLAIDIYTKILQCVIMEGGRRGKLAFQSANPRR